MFRTTIILFLAHLIFPDGAFAWGARGHALLCETAAYVASSGEKRKKHPHFLKSKSFDLAYYCNVPDIIWKRPKTYKKEFANHFMNLEYFDEVIPKKQRRGQSSPYVLSREEFNRKFKKLKPTRGRSWWRIRELATELESITKNLKQKKITKEKRHKLQAQWLLHVGIIGHYIGDLAMPLHVSKNYDGQLSGQKGIHSYFEGSMVTELYLDKNFGLQEKVYQKALERWPEFSKKNNDKEILLLVQELSRDSASQKDKLLQLDKKTGRKSPDKSMSVYRELIKERLAVGALYLALVIKKHQDFPYEGRGFFKFYEHPEFIESP